MNNAIKHLKEPCGRGWGSILSGPPALGLFRFPYFKKQNWWLKKAEKLFFSFLLIFLFIFNSSPCLSRYLFVAKKPRPVWSDLSCLSWFLATFRWSGGGLYNRRLEGAKGGGGCKTPCFLHDITRCGWKSTFVSSCVWPTKLTQSDMVSSPCKTWHDFALILTTLKQNSHTKR